jgi:hypothetical protein
MKNPLQRMKIPELIPVIIISLILYCLAYSPIINRYENPLPDRTYLGFNAFAIDWLGQLATAQQGYAGEIFRTPIMTSTMEGRPFLIKAEYLIIGRIARIFNISVLNALKTAIAVISIFYLICIWIVIKNIFPGRMDRYLAYFLTLFATGIVMPDWGFGWNNLPKFSQVFQRLTLDAPHYMLSGLFTVISVYLLSLNLSGYKPFKFILAVISGMLAVQIFFPSMMVTIVSLGLYLLVNILIRHDFTRLKKHLKIIGIYAVLVCIPLIQLWYAGNFFDMNTFKQSENIIPPVFLNIWQYYLSLGLLVIPASAGLAGFFKIKKPLLAISVLWLPAHTICTFIISRYTTTNMVRFFQTPYFFFLAVAGTYGIRLGYDFFRNKFNKTAAYIICIIFICGVIGSGFYAYKSSLNFNAPEKSDIINDLGYPGTGEYLAMNWLTGYCNRERIILAGENDSTLLLAFTPCKVYLSSWVWQGLLFNEGELLKANMLSFFQEQMTADAARKFLNENRISYVYYGNSEKYYRSLSGRTDDLTYPFLTKIYDLGAKIYRVN